MFQQYIQANQKEFRARLIKTGLSDTQARNLFWIYESVSLRS